MDSLFRAFVLAVLGLAFAAFGICHAVGSYPGAGVFARVAGEWPILWSALSFALGVLAALVGLAFLVPALRRLRGRAHRRPHGSPEPPARPAGPMLRLRPEVEPDDDYQESHAYYADEDQDDPRTTEGDLAGRRRRAGSDRHAQSWPRMARYGGR